MAQKMVQREGHPSAGEGGKSSNGEDAGGRREVRERRNQHRKGGFGRRYAAGGPMPSAVYWPFPMFFGWPQSQPPWLADAREVGLEDLDEIAVTTEDFEPEMYRFLAEQELPCHSMENGDACMTRTTSCASSGAEPGGPCDNGAEPAPSATSADEGLDRVVDELEDHAVGLHSSRQSIFEAVEAAARQALGEDFDRLELVGSAALKLDNPSSDLDAVVFRKDSLFDHETEPEQVVEVLKHIAQILQEMQPYWDVNVIESARVPILLAVGLVGEQSLSIDVSVDQQLPVDHKRWFESFGVGGPSTAAEEKVPLPKSTEEGPSSEALLLRCLRWWLVARRLPTTKEGGFPTIVWLLMAAHIHRRTVFNLVGADSVLRPASRRALLRMLAIFFGFFGSGGGFRGTISFNNDGTTQFEPLPKGYTETPQKALEALEEREMLWVGGLGPCSTTMEDALRYHFSQFGEVMGICLPVDHETGDAKGFAFVTMADEAARALALEYSTQIFQGMVVTVKPARSASSCHRFIVKNICYQTLELTLRAFFDQYGKVESAAIVRDVMTGASRGYGCVVMATADGAQSLERAIRREDFFLDGRPLIVRREVREEKQRTAGGGARRISTFSVLDPTAQVDLAPRISRATQLLHLSELQRAHDLVDGLVAGERGMGESRIRSLFERMEDWANSLPSAWPPADPSQAALAGAVFLDGGGITVGVLEAVEPKPGWSLPHLYRKDIKSSVRVLLCDVGEGTEEAPCTPMEGRRSAAFTPCDFVCRLRLEAAGPEDENRGWVLRGQWLDRYHLLRAAVPVLGPGEATQKQLAASQRKDSRRPQRAAPAAAGRSTGRAAARRGRAGHRGRGRGTWQPVGKGAGSSRSE